MNRFTAWKFDKSTAQPLYRQLFDKLTIAILTGTLPSDTPLPAERTLAKQLNLSRITVRTAYDQLEAEGFVYRKPGAGTFVTQLPQPQRPATSTNNLTAWAQRLPPAASVPIAVERPTIDFRFGRAFPHIFPYDIWRRLLARYLSMDDVMLSRYGSAAGFMPLRAAIADYLQTMRGVRCSTDQIIIISGAQQALDILARLLINPGNQVLVESPGYVEAFRIFAAHGAQLIPLPVDAQGAVTQSLPEKGRFPLAFVTPCNQFPRGGAMPLARRMQLLNWAARHNSFILEDDYDGELRYSGHPLTSLQSLDPERVIYLGTFSKLLFPALRLGYIVLPPALLTPFLQAKSLVDRGAPTLTQAAVADFITAGHFNRHLRQLRNIYGARRNTLATALKETFGPAVQFASEPAGLHILAEFSTVTDETAVTSAAAAINIGINGSSRYYLSQPAPPGFLFGFSSLDVAGIERGISLLKDLIPH